MRRVGRVPCFLMIAGVVCLLGCGSDAEKEQKPKTATERSEHRHGPHGGHIYSFDQPGFQFELALSADQKVTVYFLTPENERHFVPADKVLIRSTTGQQPREFELMPEDKNANGNASSFSLKSGLLLGALTSEIEMAVTIDGQQLTKRWRPYIH